VAVTLVLGGTRSGKSEVAERMAAGLGDVVTYVATAAVDPTDADHARRVEAHRARRPAAWPTVEVGADLPTVLASIEGPVIVDSLGTWVAACDFEVDELALRSALTTREGSTIVVSEEVGLGVHPPTELGVRFQDALGRLNRVVADIADDVWLVIAGRALGLGDPP